MSNSEVFSFAQRYMSMGGLSVIPILCDGSKKSSIKWQKYQHKKPSIDELITLFGNNGVGIAVIAGNVSGGLEVLDFDLDAEVVFSQWKEAVTAAGAGGVLETIPIQKTPSGGYHLFFRSNSPGGNAKLARRVVESGDSKEIRALIETRGEGGYAILTGSPAAVHKSGKTYDLIQGDLTKVPLIDETTRRIFLDEARALNEYFDEYKVAFPQRTEAGGERPGDNFNARTKWIEVLGPHGWKEMFTQNNETRWKAPGQHKNETAASSNHFGDEKLIVWSSNAAPFKDGKAYTKFAAYALLEHCGDFSAAAHELVKKGYGTSQVTKAKKILDLKDIQEELDNTITPSHWRRLDVSNIGSWNCKPLTVLIEGILAAGNFVFLAAQSQTKKTLLSLYISLFLLFGGKLFTKYQVNPINKILYFGLEDPDRRFQDRLLDFTEFDLSKLGANRFIIHISPGLTFLDDRYFDYFKETIRKEAATLVFLDTYQKATGGISSFDDEKQNPILHKLQNLVRELEITLIVLDHTRKRSHNKKKTISDMDDIKGTGNKPANADCVVLLDKMGHDQIKFQVWNKDFDEPVSILLRVSRKGSGKPKFTYAGDLEQIVDSMTEIGDANRELVLQTLEVTEDDETPYQGRTTKQIEKIIGAKLKESTIRNHLVKLEENKLAYRTGKGKNTRWFNSTKGSAETENGISGISNQTKLDDNNEDTDSAKVPP